MAKDYQSLSKRFSEISSNLDKTTGALIADCLLTIYQYEETFRALKSNSTHETETEEEP